MQELQSLGELCERLVRSARDAHLTVCTAESCTAGLVCAHIADVPGSSAVLKGGAVTYWDEVKHGVLGVSQATLDSFSAVSSQTASEMAKGARSLYNADIAVSTTGYAGPGGGTMKDPVGTVYMGLSRGSSVSTYRFVFDGDRAQVRSRAAYRALELLLYAVCGD